MGDFCVTKQFVEALQKMVNSISWFGLNQLLRRQSARSCSQAIFRSAWASKTRYRKANAAAAPPQVAKPHPVR